MDEKVLKDLLVSGYTITKISQLNSIQKSEVKKILDNYNVIEKNKGILKEIYNDDTDQINKNIESVLNKRPTSNITVQYRALKLFLVHGYSKRSICRMIEEIPGDGNNGNSAQKIINKKYKLKEEHRGCLFLHKKDEFESIIKKILLGKDLCKKDMKINYGRFTKKYKGTYIKLDKNYEVDNLHNVLNGELRNLIQQVFNPLKKDIGMCQYCKSKDNIENAHACGKGESRPDIFKKCVKELNKDDYISIEDLMKMFLEKHKNHEGRRTKIPPMLYLCREHHLQYDKLAENLDSDKYKEFVDKLLI